MQNQSANKTPVIYKLAVVTSIISVMAGTLTGIMTYVNLGYGPDFFSSWLTSLALAVCILVPSGFIVMKSIEWLVGRLFSSLSTFNKNIVIGVSMAIAMETIMAASTAANNIGFADAALFINAWFVGFVTALPVGLVLSIIMTLTIKPKLEKFMAS